MQTLFTHPSVSTFDRVPFQRTDEHRTCCWKRPVSVRLRAPLKQSRVVRAKPRAHLARRPDRRAPAPHSSTHTRTMLALRIARNLSRSAPAAVNAGVSRAFASSRIAANEAGAGEGDPVKDVFTRVAARFPPAHGRDPGREGARGRLGRGNREVRVEALRRRVRGARSRRRNPTRARSRDSGIRAIVRPVRFSSRVASVARPRRVFFLPSPRAPLARDRDESERATDAPLPPPLPPRAPHRDDSSGSSPPKSSRRTSRRRCESPGSPPSSTSRKSTSTESASGSKTPTGSPPRSRPRSRRSRRRRARRSWWTTRRAWRSSRRPWRRSWRTS